MKQKNYVLITLLVFYIMLVVSGCKRTYDYTFAQGIDNVEKVEICQYDYVTQTITPLMVLDESQADALLSDIDALDCKKHFGDHTEDYGEIIIYITYADGTAEVIGLWNVARVDTEGLWHIGIEYFEANEIYSILLKYVDEEVLPDLSEYLQ